MEEITINNTVGYSNKLKVLYVEDDKELQAQSKDLFEIIFASVTTADNGSIALELYKKESYDIILSDIEMPSMDGIELTQEIKKINPHQSIIIISAHNDSVYLQKFINLNVDQFISKPFDTHNILYAIYTVSKKINPFL